MPYRRPNVWGQTKPPAGTQINWGRPLAQGLKIAFTFSEKGGRICANAAAPMRPGRLTAGYTLGIPGSLGSGLSCASTGTNTVSFTQVTTSTTYSIALRLRYLSGTAGYGLLLGDGSGDGLYFLNTGTFTHFFSPSGDHVSTTVLTVNTWYDFVYSVQGGAGTFYLNGLPDGTTTSAPAINPNILGSDSFSEFFTGNLDYAYLWDGVAIGQAGAMKLRSDPFCMFTTPKRRTISNVVSASFKAAWASNANIILQPGLRG